MLVLTVLSHAAPHRAAVSLVCCASVVEAKSGRSACLQAQAALSACAEEPASVRLEVCIDNLGSVTVHRV